MSGFNSSYDIGYERKLLYLSEAIYEEASQWEKEPGIVLELDYYDCWLIPTKIRHIVEEVNVTNVNSTSTGTEMLFMSEDFPVLRVIRDNCDSLTTAIQRICPNGTIDDVFKRNHDSAIISYVQRMKAHCSHERMFDWDKLPSSVHFVLSFTIEFDAPSDQGEAKGIVRPP